MKSRIPMLLILSLALATPSQALFHRKSMERWEARPASARFEKRAGTQERELEHMRRERLEWFKSEFKSELEAVYTRGLFMPVAQVPELKPEDLHIGRFPKTGEEFFVLEKHNDGGLTEYLVFTPDPKRTKVGISRMIEPLGGTYNSHRVHDAWQSSGYLNDDVIELDNGRTLSREDVRTEF